MSWTLDRTRNVWVCTSYSDLRSKEINNLAEFGQPMSPKEPGFDSKFVPDFAKVKIEMPQNSVMTEGYGAMIQAGQFPIVHRFLYEALPIPFGSNYHWKDLVQLHFAVKKDRFIKSNLYGTGDFQISSGSISSQDAKYIHGTVGFALMDSTRFIYSPTVRRVEAEIGALDDNWDFESDTIPNWLNAVVKALVAPKNYHLTAPIVIQYRGPGKFSVAQR